MSKEMRKQINKVKNWKQFLNEMVNPHRDGNAVSYKEAPERVKEFAEGLKSHLEKNGYTIVDNPVSEVVDKRNIIFFFSPYDGSDGDLYVYYDINNDQQISSIVNYLVYFNESKFGLAGKADEYTASLQGGYMVWHLVKEVTKDGKTKVENMVKFRYNRHFRK
jgi:hypothetical protein